jgi:hypothetical protein
MLPNDLETLEELKGKIDKRLPQQEYSEGLSLCVVRMALTLKEDWLREKARRGQVEGAKMKSPRVRENVCRLLGILYSIYSSVMQTYLNEDKIYESVRSGNAKAKDCRIPNTKAVQVLVRTFVRSSANAGASSRE